MLSLRPILVSIAVTAAATVFHSTSAQAAIVGGQISGTWKFYSDGSGGLSVGDSFTADYTYDSDSVDDSYAYAYSSARLEALDQVATHDVGANSASFSGAVPTSVPTPALLPGLIGLGVSVLRRRKQEFVVLEK